MKLSSKLTIALITMVSTVAMLWLLNNNATSATTKASADFYADIKPNVADEDNLLLAVTGLGAPEGEDIIQYGRQKINTFYGTKDIKSRFALAGKPQPNEVHIVAIDEKDEVDCNDDATVELLNGACITPRQLETLIQQNSLLLERYLSLQALTDWQGPQAYSDRDLKQMHLNSLLYAYNNLLLTQGNSEQAFELWKGNHAFILNALSLEMDGGNKLDFIFAYEASLKALGRLLIQAPDTVMAHHKEINPLLPLNGFAKYNTKGMLRAEYLWHNTHAFSLENAEKNIDFEHFRNKTYSFHQDLLAMADLPPNQLSQARKALYDKHNVIPNNKLLLFIKRHSQNNKKLGAEVIFHQLMWGAYPLIDFNEMHVTTALMRSLKAAINIHQQQVKPHAVQDFLDQAGEAYHCPFTEKPMVYDVKKHALWCENPANDNYETNVRLAAQ